MSYLSYIYMITTQAKRLFPSGIPWESPLPIEFQKFNSIFNKNITENSSHCEILGIENSASYEQGKKAYFNQLMIIEDLICDAKDGSPEEKLVLKVKTLLGKAFQNFENTFSSNTSSENQASKRLKESTY